MESFGFIKYRYQTLKHLRKVELVYFEIIAPILPIPVCIS